jgi:hypothetical protein
MPLSIIGGGDSYLIRKELHSSKVKATRSGMRHTCHFSKIEKTKFEADVFVHTL